MKRSAAKRISALFLIAMLSATMLQPVMAEDNTVTFEDGTTGYIWTGDSNSSSIIVSGNTTSSGDGVYVDWEARKVYASRTEAMEDPNSNLNANTNARTRASSRTSSTVAASSSGNFVPSKKYPYADIKAAIGRYQKTNDDVKGWIIVPGTNINEPILFSNQDNYYYLNRDWKGNYYSDSQLSQMVTSAFADCRMKFANTWQGGSRNTVIYGHNWTNLRDPLDIGSNNNHKMFGQLPSYTNLDFALANPYIYYSTDQVEGIWKVFAVAYAEETFAYNTTHPTKESYKNLINQWKERSLFDFNVDVNENDRILTLSTCTRVYPNAGDAQRYVVVARLLREGESENDKVTATVNPDRKTPQF